MASVSVVTTHWAMNRERGAIMRASYGSLFKTAPDAEIIVVDNGESLEDSQWLLEQAQEGRIACYVRNRKNMHFGFARNQGLALCSGEYIVICDNDIVFEEGWLEGCVEFLAAHPGRYLATPIASDPMNSVRKARWCGEVGGWRLNYRAGSNVFVMRRADYEAIGGFDLQRVAGSKYVDRYNRMGYVMAVMPEPKATDIALRRGYNINEDVARFSL